MGAKDLRIVLRGVGLLAPVVGVMALLSLPVAIIFRETYAIGPLVLTAVLSLVVGVLLYMPFRRAGETELKHALIIAALGWLAAAGIGAVPFYLISLQLPAGLVSPYSDIANAFFDSVSGFTTTGLSMSLRPELLPRTLQWWRSFTQWIGGVGIIVFVLTLLASTGASAANLYYAEGRGEKIHPSVASSLRTTWGIYSLYTAVGAFLLWGAGMPMWPALNHAMAALSTGGFSISSASIAGYPGIAVELVTVFLMLLGSISFVVHYSIMQKGVGMLWKNHQTRGFLLFALGWAIILFLSNLAAMSPEEAARLSYFQALSAATTTGFQTADLSNWTPAAKLILTGAMFVGATIGSTAGGLKAIRVSVLLRAAGWQMRRASSGRSEIVPFRLGGRSLPTEEADRLVNSAAATMLLWLCSLVLGVIALVHVLPPSTNLVDIIFEVNSAQSTVGLSTGITQPGMPMVAKLVLIFNMWVGRLEIIPVLMLLRALFLRRD